MNRETPKKMHFKNSHKKTHKWTKIYTQKRKTARLLSSSAHKNGARPWRKAQGGARSRSSPEATFSFPMSWKQMIAQTNTQYQYKRETRTLYSNCTSSKLLSIRVWVKTFFWRRFFANLLVLDHVGRPSRLDQKHQALHWSNVRVQFD